jgi:threonine dehydrogenase-like Zn-dependent dehydrogenase
VWPRATLLRCQRDQARLFDPTASADAEQAGKPINHGVILKAVATNICGSDQHMVRGRTTAPVGMVLGHEVTGEIIEVGSDVEYHKVGDIVSVPWLVAAAVIVASNTPASA